MAAPATTDQILRFFFRVQGRIGRQEYALGIGVVYPVNFAILFYLLTRHEIGGAMLLLLTAVSIPVLVALIVLMAKRCHDLGLPGTFFLLALVPLVGCSGRSRWRSCRAIRGLTRTDRHRPSSRSRVGD